ncbi:EAL domain-containing protein [Pseudokineococcus basanitobsidens]|uniref:EAL domain-containing protein n=1 Tax=Pseudokineococcus basanitobsidens TaxID=1926649 RepID=A0ABU8RI05_9ACTN
MLSDRPAALTGADVAVLEVLADLVAVQLGRLEADAAVRTRRESAVARHLEPGGMRMVLQPVVDLVDGRVVALEALARPSTGCPPDRAFAEAAEVGLGVELELAAVRAALALLPHLPADVDLSVNAGPAAAEDPRLLDLVVAAGAPRVVVELTEHDDLADRPRLGTALRRLREAGARIAIDDAGAGYAGLRSIVDVAPEVLKLDIGLVRGLDADPARRSLVRALVALAQDLGAVLVAEGVETTGELEALRRLGVCRGQGWLLGVPADPVELDLGPRRLLALPVPRRG